MAIGVLGAMSAVSRTSGIARALREDLSVDVRIKATRALGRLGMPEGLQPLLVAVATGGPVALRVAGAGALGSQGAVAATEGLAGLLGDRAACGGQLGSLAAAARRAALRASTHKRCSRWPILSDDPMR
ncbi:HEAT repeat domain-containing protein [Streptomyces sp. NPDC002788]